MSSLRDEQLRQSIEICNERLKKQLHSLNIGPDLKSHYKAIKLYYRQGLVKAVTPRKKKLLVREYEAFISTLEQVASRRISVQEAIGQLPNHGSESSIILHNVLIVCDLLFWTLISSMTYITWLVFGGPLLIFDSLFGFALTVGLGVLFTATIYSALERCLEFKTFDGKIINEHKKDVLTFFRHLKPYDLEQDLDLEEQETTLVL